MPHGRVVYSGEGDQAAFCTTGEKSIAAIASLILRRHSVCCSPLRSASALELSSLQQREASLQAPAAPAFSRSGRESRARRRISTCPQSPVLHSEWSCASASASSSAPTAPSYPA